jgi:hypothetical protein
VVEATQVAGAPDADLTQLRPTLQKVLLMSQASFRLPAFLHTELEGITTHVAPGPQPTPAHGSPGPGGVRQVPQAAPFPTQQNEVLHCALFAQGAPAGDVPAGVEQSAGLLPTSQSSQDRVVIARAQLSVVETLTLVPGAVTRSEHTRVRRSTQVASSPYH